MKAERPPDSATWAAEATWVEVQQRLFDQRYTGQTLVKWNQGYPCEVQVLRPPELIQVRGQWRAQAPGE